MAVEDPQHPCRAMGQAVENEYGSTDEQMSELRRKMSRSVAALKKQNYDATKFTEEHNHHKHLMNARFLNCISRVHENVAMLADLPGFVAILDDFDEQGALRTAEALMTDLGVPAHKIISPNRNPTIVAASKAKGLLAEVGDFNRVIDKHFFNHQIAAAYLDLTTGDPIVVDMAVDTVYGKCMYNAAVLATTMVERSFTKGGTEPFTKRVLHLTENLKSRGYRPAYSTVAQSYFEIASGGRRVATQFWTLPCRHRRHPEGRAGGQRIYGNMTDTFASFEEQVLAKEQGANASTNV
jgi:hypothetical protein